MTLEQFERRARARYLRWLLRKHGGNITAAAETAGVHRQNLYDILRRAGLRERRVHGNAQWRDLAA